MWHSLREVRIEPDMGAALIWWAANSLLQAMQETAVWHWWKAAYPLKPYAAAYASVGSAALSAAK
jgi:hypothetical protein